MLIEMMMATRRIRQLRGRIGGGFTLIELILVMLVLTIVVGTAMPSLKGFLGWSRSRDAVAQLVSLAQYARSKSAADAQVYKLCADGGSCWLAVQQGENFARVTDEMADPALMPEGGIVEYLPPANNSAAGASADPGIDTGASIAAPDGILFYPDGRTGTGLLRFTAPTGRVTLLGSPSPAESFRVLSPQEAGQL